MQNIQAPSTESIKTYRGYNNMDLSDSGFVYMIPVFQNMPSKTELPSSASPNNYLSTLSVNGDYLFDKPTDEDTFDLVLDGNTKSIDIDATKINYQATISGVGSVSVLDDENSIKLTVTAGNGSIRIYTINITKKQNDSLSLDISEILRLLEINNDGTYIYGFELNTGVDTIINSIMDKENKASVSYYDKDNNEKNNGIIASGDKLRIKTDREEKEYIMVIYGDVNGDGKIAATDYVAIKNHIMDIKKLNEFEKMCADVNRDGKVAATDYVAIKNHIMDVKKITQ